jgi:hypothetical protein
MKFTEALRLGSLLCEQTFHVLQDDDGACALGTALLAITGDAHAAVWPKEWMWLGNARMGVDDVPPELAEMVREHARTLGRITDTMSVADAVVRLNDHLRWSRERIADWLEPLEERYRSSAPEESGILAPSWASGVA